jgi:hypothetical protein
MGRKKDVAIPIPLRDIPTLADNPLLGDSYVSCVSRPSLRRDEDLGMMRREPINETPADVAG